MFIFRSVVFIRRAKILSFILVMAMLPCAYASDPVERRVSGEWRFAAALDGAEIVSLDEREAKQLLGQVFTIRKSKVKFGKMDCGETEFDSEIVEPRLHLREAFHASSKELGLPNPVTVVDLSCTSVFITKPNHLVIFWQGWFFDAVRVKK
jgi:hypothetical protein